MVRYKPKAALIDKPVTINFTSSQKQQAKRAARAAGMTFSAWVRRVTMKAAGRVK